MNSPITTHVLDTSLGKPAAGIPVVLSRSLDEGTTEIARGLTDEDGRIGDLIGPSDCVAGEYCITFELSDYYASQEIESFYPRATVEFRVADPTSHYHVPLLLSPYGYSTYRGS